MAGIDNHLKKNRDLHLTQLEELLAIPSVSTASERKADVRRAADWVRRRLKAAGCTKTELCRTAGHPIVYGEWLGAEGAPTILVYGHYDVQPAEPLELWTTPPFQPTVRNGSLYARGASDDKGQFLTHVLALEAHLATSKSCPINVKFCIEGEEEIGSPNLEGFLRKNRKRLAADAVVISDTAMFGDGIPSIVYGLRGLCYLEVLVRGTDRDLHSGTYGGAVVNPANALAQMLASVKDARGRVAVPGFYEAVRRLSMAERRAWAALPHSDRKFKRSIGAPELSGEAGYSTLERLWARPSLDVNGIWGGFDGEGAKTVIAAEAGAKISARLVPDQTPKEIARKISYHLRKVAPKSVKVTIRELHGGEPWVAPTDHPALNAARRAVKRVFRTDAVLVREGGSIPIVSDFEKLLRVPAVLVGFGRNDDNIHAPNEKLDLDGFYSGIRTSAFLMEEFAQVDGAPSPGRRRPAR